MTWNAFATCDGKLVSFKEDGIFKFRDPILEQEFSRADNEVRSKSFLKSDLYLIHGGIKANLVLNFIKRATGITQLDEGGWSAEKVQYLNAISNWDFMFEEEDAWAYWSGLIFLRTCAQHSLGIWYPI